MPRLDLFLEPKDVRLHLLQLVDQWLKTAPDQDGQVFIGIILHHGNELRQAGSLLRRNDAELGKVASNCIDQHSPLLNQKVSASVKNEHRLLID